MLLPKLHLYRPPQSGCSQSGSIMVHDTQLTVWQVASVETSCMDFSFEQVIERLLQLPRLFAEPDGSFVWRGTYEADENAVESLRIPSLATPCDLPIMPPTDTWQLEGMLYDRALRLTRVELHGSCPRRAWLQFLECIQPRHPLIAYLVEFRCFVLASDLQTLWER